MKKLKPTKTNRKKLDAQISKIVTKMIKEKKYQIATYDKDTNRYKVTYLLSVNEEKKLNNKEKRKVLTKEITKNLNLRGTKLSKKSLSKKLIELRSKTTITETFSKAYNTVIKKRGLTESQINAVRDQSLPKLRNIFYMVTKLYNDAKPLVIKDSSNMLDTYILESLQHLTNAITSLDIIKKSIENIDSEEEYNVVNTYINQYWQEKEQFELSLKNARATMYDIDRQTLNASELLLVSTLTDKISDILQDYQSITYERRKYKDAKKNDQILLS
jgi:hypothetical protein